MKIKHIALLLLMIATEIKASEYSVAGYIITNQGDTLRGYIENTNSKSFRSSCLFRKSTNSEFTHFSPDRIQEFGLDDGRCFVSRKFSIDQKDSICFFEYLIRGQINIFHLETDSCDYYAEKNGMMYPLTNTARYTHRNSTSYHTENREYLGVLSNLMNDADIFDDVQKTKLTSNSLVELTRYYHDKVCNGSCIVYERKKKPISIKKSFYLGDGYYKFGLGDLMRAERRVNAAYAGFRMEMENPFGWRENLSFSMDLQLAYVSKCVLKSLDADNRFVSNNNEKWILTSDQQATQGIHSLPVKLNLLNLQIPLVFNYNFTHSTLTPYLGGGVKVNWAVNQKFEYSIPELDYTNKHLIPCMSYGFIGKAGLKYSLTKTKYLFTELALDWGTGNSSMSYLRYYYSNISALVGLGF